MSTRQWIDLFSNWERAIEQIVERSASLLPKELSLSPRPFRSEEDKRKIFPASKFAIVCLALVALAFCVFIYAFYFILESSRGSLVKTQASVREQGDLSAVFQETDASRVGAFTICTPPSEVKAGFRNWTRVAPDRWLEEYPDGTKVYMRVIKRINFAACDGAVVSPIFDDSFQVYFPDNGCPWKEFLFRRLPNVVWNSYVSIEKAGFECTDRRR